MTDATYTEFSFSGTPDESKAMHAALQAHVDRGDVKILLSTAGGLDPLAVAETIRVMKGAKDYEGACKIAREHAGA
ncbi:hypothetical protein PPSIR1_40874 [Plesiocystis pacifica SIR-1]|uniref:Uncharacterized protein n=1 Tax=Plesiocystis pacifica SIR-1 TaxID=391625 RepID=A6GHF2_9BACT|nr:hypothetical protein [Plesiocystis pacifica]EDM74716.1 hypothetical protein PPSIR1_40874 [Plesiocystis pacifica SIR-1]